jgi:hypothetical protein
MRLNLQARQRPNGRQQSEALFASPFGWIVDEAPITKLMSFFGRTREEALARRPPARARAASLAGLIHQDT